MKAASRFYCRKVSLPVWVVMTGWLLQSLSLPAQTIPATMPDLDLTTAGSVNCFAAQPDGKIIIGGGFSAVDGFERHGLARLNPDGTLDPTWSADVVGSVNQLFLSGTNLYVSGSFTQIGGVSLNNLAKVSISDSGTVNTNWAPNPQTDGYFNGNGEIQALAVIGTNVYVSGYFFYISGYTCPYIAKLDAFGVGALDPNWFPLPNQPYDGSLPPGIVNAMATDGTNLYVGGTFVNIGGYYLTNIAKLNLTTGAADPTWYPYPMPNADVGALALDGSGHLFAGGSFTSIGGQNRTCLAKISAASPAVVDASWNPVLAPALGQPTPNLISLALSGTNLFFTGEFTNVSGVNVGYAGKVATGGTGAPDTNWQANFNITPGSILTTPSTVFFGGGFQTCNGVISPGIASFDPNADLFNEFYQGQVTSPGQIYAIARQSDGKLLIGGNFFLAQGLAHPNIVRVNTDDTLDDFWIPQVNGTVHSISTASTNVFIGGEFTQVGGQTRNHLALLSTFDGDMPDPNWNPGTDNPVFTILMTNTDMYIAGTFSQVGGISRNCIAKLGTTGFGAVDLTWNPAPSGFNEAGSTFCQGLAIGGTNLFVGGNFTGIGGQARNSIAKLSLTGTGSADPTWNPGCDRDVLCLAVNDTSVFAGGQFETIGGRYFGSGVGNLAKLDINNTGTADPNWTAISDYDRTSTSALALVGTNLYAGGSFYNIGGVSRLGIARVSISDPAVVDTNWEYDAVSLNAELAGGTTPAGDVLAILPDNNDVYVGGIFDSIAGAVRNSFALIAQLSAPQLIQSSPTNFYIYPAGTDGPEVTYFQITSVTNGSLFLNDDVTPVTPGEFISLAQGAAGLVGSVGTTISVVEAVDDTGSPACGTPSSSVMLLTNPVVFSVASPTYSVTEGDGNVAIYVLKYGSGAGSINYATADITAVSGKKYLASSGTLNFSATDQAKDIVIPIADDLTVDGDETFAVNLSSPSAGSTLSSYSNTVVTIIDNNVAGSTASETVTALPSPLPDSSGSLSVDLQPSAALGQWRLIGSQNWQSSDATVAGLTTGNYSVEFRPVNGYLAPPTVTLAINAGQVNYSTNYYAVTTNGATGSITVNIEPDDVAGNTDPTQRGQWRQQGGATNWLDSGDVISNLVVGDCIVEFKPLSGRLTPDPELIQLSSGTICGVSATYLFSSAGVAPTPAVVPFPSAATNAPYCFNGQLQTSVGFGSGFVVQPRVVLTAGHVLFDDNTLSYASTANWFLERYTGQVEPPPLTPRGWYVFDGYATQRAIDNSPGISTPASQDMDAAAIYFLQDAGRGGYGGYLSDDAANNEYLMSMNNKFLVGYPLDGVAGADQGKLFSTTPANLDFTRLYTEVFATTNIQSYPGNSGGPLYVQTDVNQYQPAGIFLGGSGETLVRAINGDVVDLINRGVASGNGGPNSTGGGVTVLSPGLTTSAFGSGLLTVNLTPTGTIYHPGWRIQGFPNTNYTTAASSTVSLVSGSSYPVQFNPVPGFITPSNRTVQMAANQTVTIQANYLPILPVLNFRSLTNLTFTGATGATYRVDFATNLAGLIHWTPVVTQTLVASSITISNLSPPTNRMRFYRTVLLP